MSNQICLVATEFKNTISESSTYGYRLYDSYDATYNNTLTEEAMKSSDLDLLRLALVEYCNDCSDGMASCIEDNETGIEINGTWYDYDEVKDVLNS